MRNYERLGISICSIKREESSLVKLSAKLLLFRTLKAKKRWILEVVPERNPKSAEKARLLLLLF